MPLSPATPVRPAKRGHALLHNNATQTKRSVMVPVSIFKLLLNIVVNAMSLVGAEVLAKTESARSHVHRGKPNVQELASIPTLIIHTAGVVETPARLGKSVIQAHASWIVPKGSPFVGKAAMTSTRTMLIVELATMLARQTKHARLGNANFNVDRDKPNAGGLVSIPTPIVRTAGVVETLVRLEKSAKPGSVSWIVPKGSPFAGKAAMTSTPTMLIVELATTPAHPGKSVKQGSVSWIVPKDSPFVDKAAMTSTRTMFIVELATTPVQVESNAQAEAASALRWLVFKTAAVLVSIQTRNPNTVVLVARHVVRWSFVPMELAR